MAYYIEGNTSTPAPEGVNHAVCVDVVDLGIVNGAFGPRKKVRLMWESEQTRDDGKRFLIAKQYSPSLHEKASLRKDLKQWRGRDFSADELKKFDLESIIGVPCQLVIVHEEKDGTVYGNVTAIMKADPNHRILPNGQYVRVKDRPGAQPPATAQSNDANEDTVPF